VTTLVPRYRTSVIQWASGVRVTGTFEPHIIRYVASHQSPDSGTSVWSPNTCGLATGRSAYQS
jgi:hypothetical protein